MSRRRGLAAALLASGALVWDGAGAFAYEPQVNYMLQCMGCHTPDGGGEPGRVPSVKQTLVPFAKSPEGRRFLVQVPGASQAALSDAELATLINWMIQNLSEVEPKGVVPYTESEIARYRRTPLVDVKGARERLIASLPKDAVPPP